MTKERTVKRGAFQTATHVGRAGQAYGMAQRPGGVLPLTQPRASGMARKRIQLPHEHGGTNGVPPGGRSRLSRGSRKVWILPEVVSADAHAMLLS